MYITGCRKGEALALHWSDIDFNNKTVKFQKTITKETEDAAWAITSPKTENSYRINSLPKNLLDVLVELHKTSEGDFVWHGNTPISFSALQNRFVKYVAKAQAKAKEEDRKEIKYIRIHDLRHSCVSYMINHGQNEIATIYVIAKWIGDTVEQIYKTYGHLFPDHQEKLVAEWENLSFVPNLFLIS